ncbi:hypothetical protein LPH50_08810 [Xylella taiwanensis]|uniref:Phage-related protein n=1 Tax=Xylella taiwanensis TaxID=1444770 RepID=A0ABS8TXD6_9GAMM|nr:hypothetical protein [Xylella taiwanensis]AXI83015.1 hypothetical protein AB672_03155 [Xylella taiwanensis]MCD8456041.1 hypothetical protein [Xylella taiwanensis]MCD8458445.1 hypothetical protein [Xylella taiwanensis]MCD8460581.1 hypothetical protein [Xylella taiwanensis]MCD8463357.1 hypothetical protein [Xylella taiwanensis]
MSNPGELLARLTPGTVRYGVPHGGTPDLTAQDIAHGLALVPAGLGRDVLEACWWPDGAALRRSHLRDTDVALVVREIQRQQQRLAEARTDLGIAKACLGWSGPVTSAQRAERDRAALRLEQVKDSLWPQTTLDMLPALVAAVISEMAQPSLCPSCYGRGERRVGALLKVCDVCNGSGIVAMSDCRRAAAIGRDEAAYRRRWRGVYEWLLEQMRHAERQAALELHEALRREAA